MYHLLFAFGRAETPSQQTKQAFLSFPTAAKVSLLPPTPAQRAWRVTGGNGSTVSPTPERITGRVSAGAGSGRLQRDPPHPGNKLHRVHRRHDAEDSVFFVFICNFILFCSKPNSLEQASPTSCCLLPPPLACSFGQCYSS